MAQGYLLQTRQRTLTNAIAAAVGYKLYVYASGSSTPADTFTDAGLTVANTNPLIADADGFFGPLWVPAGSVYKLVLKTDADVQVWSLDGQEAMPSAAAAGAVTAVPTGGMILWPDPSALPGVAGTWLVCDGSLVSRSTYSALAAVYAAMATPYPYGVGDGSTTFALPDFRGRFPLAQAASGTGATIGGTGGSLDHTHTGPSHTHVVTVPRDGWGGTLNNPATQGRIRTADGSGVGTEATAGQATADQNVTSAAGGTGVTGTGNPAYLVAGCWIVKT